MKSALFIIAHRGFQDHEYGIPKKMLEDAGIQINVASTQKGMCIGKFGAETKAQYTLEEVSGDDYDVVIYIGGPGVSGEFSGNKEYFRIAKEAKLLAAICIAPAVLSDSGIFTDKRVTSWDGNGEQKAQIEANGGIYTGESLSIDGNIITADGPDSAQLFGEAILQYLQK